MTIKKQSGDVLKASEMNQLGSMAEQVARIGSTNHVYRSESGGATTFDSLPSWKQRMLFVKEKVDERTFLVQTRYYSFDDQKWKNKNDEWELDTSKLEVVENTFDNTEFELQKVDIAAGDVIPGFWDRVEGKWVPIISTPSAGCDPMRMIDVTAPIFSVDGPDDYVKFQAALIISETGVDNWLLPNGRTYMLFGQSADVLTGFSTFPVDKTSFVRLVYRHNEDPLGRMLRDKGIAIRFIAKCNRVTGTGGFRQTSIASTWRAGRLQRSSTVINNDVESSTLPAFEKGGDGRTMKIHVPSGERWLIQVDFAIRLVLS